MLSAAGQTASSSSSIGTVVGSVFDATSGNWNTIATTGAPAWAIGMLSLVVGRRLVIIGGDTNFLGRSAYDLDTAVWTTRTEPTNANPALISGNTQNIDGVGSFSAGFVVGRWILVLTGQDSFPGFRLGQTALWLYDASVDKWTAAAAFPLAQRTSALVAVAGGKWVVWSGSATDGSGLLTDGAVFDPEANRWATMPAAGAPAARRSMKAAADAAGTKAFFFGGSDPPPPQTPEYDDGGVFDVASNTWASVPPSPHPPALLEQLTVHMGAFGNRLVVLRRFSANVSVFDASSRQWTVFPETACAANTNNDNVVPYAIYKNKLLLAGTNLGTGVGGISLYDLASTAAVNLDGQVSPVARTGAVMSWTGNHLVVVGGQHEQRTCFGSSPSSCQTSGTTLPGGFTLTW
jgi:hypothetical protein